MNDSALLRATSSKVRENPFLTDSDRRDGQDVVGRTFIPGMAPAGGQAAVGGGRRGLRQGPVPQASDVAGDDGRQPAAQGCGLADGAGAAAAGRRGRPRVYGEGRIDLAKQAGSVAAGRPGCSTSTASGRGSGTRRSWRRGDRWRGRSGWCWWTSRAGGWPSSAPTCRRTWPRFSRRSPTGSRWRPRSPIARRSSEPASSRCGSCGQISVHSTCCLWTFTLTKAWARCRGVDELVDRSEFRGTHDPKPPREPRGQAWRAR